MVSANRTLQTRDQCGGTLPCTIHPAGNGILLSALTTPQVKDQFSHESDYTPKARKPYKITKQRERWTEEEHKKFLEALKLYGRAWRRIKEHVGTKTAVQIRSHAQKFFSKVVRNSSADNTSMVEPVEIPPPRPKRKPMHPYPRKIVNPLSKEPLVLEKPLRSSSNLSISEQENQSPTSVLSVSASDATGSTNSNTPIHSVSPVSSTDGLHAADFVHLEGNLSLEDNGCPSPAPITASSASDEQFPKKLDLLPNRNLIREEGVIEETTVRSLKLFGTTVLVTECYRPSSPTVDISKSQPSELNEVIFEQKPGLNLMVTELHSADTECIWSHCPQRNAGALGCMHLQKEKSNPTEAGFAASLPRWNFYGGTPFAFIPFDKQELVKAHADSNREEAEGKETQKEGSLSGSNPRLVHEGGNVCDHSRQFTYGNKGMYPDLELKSDGKPTIAKLRAIPHTYAKGFVPYKKRVVEGESQSSPMTGGEREKQRICLCL